MDSAYTDIVIIWIVLIPTSFVIVIIWIVISL